MQITDIKYRIVKHHNFLVFLLLLLMAIQGLMSANQKSVTIDEMMYIGAGFYHWKAGDFQLNMTNPPIMKLVSALPLLFTNATLPESIEDPKNWSLIRQWQFARDFLYKNIVRADNILILARILVMLVSILLGIYVFRWSRELYGVGPALLSLFLFSCSPNILAHSRLATHDLGLAAFMFITCFYFWKYLNISKMRNLLLCGIFMGLSFLTKTTAIFLIPILCVYAFIRALKNNEARDRIISANTAGRNVGRLTFNNLTALMVAGAIAIIVLNAGYGFQGTFDPIPVKNPEKLQEKIPLNKDILDIATKVPIPFPTPYLELIKFQRSLTKRSGNVYFAGKIYEKGLWYLMLVSFLIKTPIPMIIIFIASLYFIVRNYRSMDAEWLMIVFVATIFFVFSYMSNINMGLRYVLPIFPFIYLMAGRLLSDIDLRRKWAVGATGILCVWYLISSLNIYPHYLAYFNEFVGGPKNGYKYLVDSNLDWGQDLKGLKKYMDEKGIDKIKLGYFGSADANYYGINYEYLPSVGLAPQKPGQYWWYEIDGKHRYDPGPQKGWIAVSATLLESPGWMKAKFYDTYAWLREYEPNDQVGYSILIYHIE